MTTLSIMDIIEDTTVDGPGFRTTIYAAGCPHHCPNCHNPQTWNINAGHPMTVEQIMQVIRADEFADVTFSGGDPMFQPEAFATLAQTIKQQTRKNIWCYTGYTYEQILNNPLRLKLLHLVDVLVDGPYIEAQHDPDLLFRGSRNQRLIDIPASLHAGKVTLFAQ